MRVAYTCHDSLPSSGANTQQTFWTMVEVARLGVSVQLLVPSLLGTTDEPGASGAGGVGRETGEGLDRDPPDPRDGVATFYGVPPGTLPDTLSLVPLGRRSAESLMQKVRFDWGLGRYLTALRRASDSPDLVWTRDPLALVSCLHAGLPTLFETYRPDFATRARFALWRRRCLDSPHLRGVIAHSRLAADAYLAAGVPAARVLVAYNGFAPSLFEPRLTRAAARARLALPADGPLVVYAGHTDPGKGVDAIVRMAAAVPSAHTVIVGAAADSADGRRLLGVARQVGARNLRLCPQVPLAEVPAYLYAADCLVIPPTDDPLRRFRRTVLPIKVFMYLAAGRPILAPRLPDIEEILTDGETARLVGPNDIVRASTALAELLSDAPLRERLSRNALSAAAGYTWEARARRLVGFITDSSGGPRGGWS